MATKCGRIFFILFYIKMYLASRLFTNNWKSIYFYKVFIDKRILQLYDSVYDWLLKNGYSLIL